MSNKKKEWLFIIGRLFGSEDYLIFMHKEGVMKNLVKLTVRRYEESQHKQLPNGANAVISASKEVWEMKADEFFTDYAFDFHESDIPLSYKRELKDKEEVTKAYVMFIDQRRQSQAVEEAKNKVTSIKDGEGVSNGKEESAKH